MDTGQHRRVLIIAAVLGILCFIPMSLRLYDLMILQYDKYAQLALDNQSRTTGVSADRGSIYDRNMEVLACSVTVEDVYLDPKELKQAGVDLTALSEELAAILELDPQWVLNQAKDLSMRYKRLKAAVDEQTAKAVRSYINSNNISGVHLEPSTARFYPQGTLAAQLIGFTNASGVGCEGIEASYNSFLQGKSGAVITTKGNNEMDMPYSYEAFQDPQTGCSLVLTIDLTVQSCLEQQLQNAIARYDVQNGAFGVVMNVKTGEVLAMATLGSYDPNRYLEILDPTVPDDPESQKQARLKQWRNRVISDGYEPGSTFKVLTLAAALDTGAVNLESGFYCGGAEKIPGRSQLLHCWRSAGHGSQQTPQALQNSCNLAFAHIGLSLGGERFYEYVQRFGILEKTGIDLQGESKGVFFDRELIENTEKWGTASLTSASFGQTFKLTPMQLVRAIAAVVNGGYLMEPYVVSTVVDKDGNVVLQQEPTVIRQVISNETSGTMCTLLQSVVEQGTAKNAQVAGFSIGGKTGTSEKIDVLDENGKPTLDKIVSFVGVAPMDDPRYIILIALDTPSRQTGMYISGGVMAAPTVGGLFAELLPYWSVAKAEEDTLITVPDLTGMTEKEVKAALKELGLEYVKRADADTVTAQIPAPGQTVPQGSQLLAYFGEVPEYETVAVPDFSGMTRQQASETAGKLGLFLQITGNTEVSPRVVVTDQSQSAGTLVRVGTTLTLRFTDIQTKE